MIRFLAISLFFILTSCSLQTTEGLRQTELLLDEISNPYFENQSIDYVYKAKIEVYNNNLGGILIIKKTSPKNHRIVMTTEFGGKLLDLEFDGNSFTKNFVIEELDRKFILNVLKADFELLLIDKAVVVDAYESDIHRVFKTQNDKRFNFYFIKKSSKKLEKIVNTSKTKEKVEINFSSSDGEIAEGISIVHSNIKLKIDLEKFKEDAN